MGASDGATVKALDRLLREMADTINRCAQSVVSGRQSGRDGSAILVCPKRMLTCSRLRPGPDRGNLQAYGAPGVVKIIRILEREIATGMRLLGAASVNDLVPGMVCYVLKVADRF